MKLGEMGRGALLDVWSVVLAAYCIHCGEVADEGEWAPLLCHRCAECFPLWGRAVPVPGPLDGGSALARFEGPAKALLVDLKYRGLLRAGWMVGRRMASADGAQPRLRGSTLIVPVPLHWRRRWARGHNQAMTLVRGMVSRRERHRACSALVRGRATRAQVGLGRGGRLENVRGAFEVTAANAARVREARVLLVDDVVTTGATAAAAAEALKRGGAAEVWLYAAAWARPPGS